MTEEEEYRIAIALWEHIKICIWEDALVPNKVLKGMKRRFLAGFDVDWNSNCWLCEEIGQCDVCTLDPCNENGSSWNIVDDYVVTGGKGKITKQQALNACDTIIRAHKEYYAEHCR